MAESLLPAELYSLVARNLAVGDLHAMSLTSRLANGAATPFLYQRIVLQLSTSVEAAVSLFNTFTDRDDLAKMVQHHVLDWTGPPNRIVVVATLLQTSFPRFVNLQHLTVSRSLGIHTWIFDDVTLPALRDFHCFARHPISLSFLVRHPNLRTLTFSLPQGRDTIRDWGFELEEIRLWDGSAGDLLRLFKDGELRPALRRVAWTEDVTSSELSALAVQCPNVEQINQIATPQFDHNDHGGQWSGVRRLGVVLNAPILGPYGEGLFIYAARALPRFPDLQTLDFIFMDAISLSSEQLNAVDTAVQALYEAERIQLVTAAGRAYIRDPSKPDSKFRTVYLQDEHSASVIPWKLMFPHKQGDQSAS